MDQQRPKLGQEILPESKTSSPDAGLFGDAPAAVPIRLASDPLKADVKISREMVGHGRRFAGLALIVVAIVVAGLITFLRTTSHNTPSSSADATARYATQPAPVNIAQRLQTAPAAGTLTVNGQLDVAGSLTLAPTTQPTQAQAGQLYFDQGTSKLGYYNGKSFVYLQSSQVNGPVTNNNITNVTNSNITNVAGPTNITNVTNTYVTSGPAGALTGAGGTAGSIAMFTGPTTLGDSLISQSGAVLATTAGTLQGNDAAGLSVLTADAAGVTGALTLQSGNSATASSGTVTLDTGSGVVNGTLVEDYTFETGVDGFTGTPYGTAVAQTNAAAHTGVDSLAVPLSLSSWSSASVQGITVTPGHEYRYTAWVRAATASAPVVSSVYFRTVNTTSSATTTNDTTGGWTEIAGVFVDPAGNTQLDMSFVYEKDANEMHYLDDVTLTDLNTFTGLNVNVGTTNAQAINIGNGNQAGDTTITGGTTGVKINDATGDIDIGSGAGVNLTAATDSSFATSGALLLQGGAASGPSIGGIAINTTPQTGSSGSISILTGDSSTTASGNIAIDAGSGFVSGTVVDDKDFESGPDAMESWFGDTVGETNAQSHGGAESFYETGTGAFWGIIQNGNVSLIPIVAGHHYFFSAWVRAATTPRSMGGHIVWSGGSGSPISLTTVTDSTTGWTQMTASGVAPAGTTGAIWEISGTEAIGETHYFDDLVTTDLSSSSATSEIDLGATNAQILNIGNMNEIGATTIQGGSGIALDSGAANFTINGGAINVSGTGASQMGTSSGSLTLNAGGGTGGGVIVRPQVDSTTDFQVQNASGAALFTADSQNNAIVLGTDNSPQALTVRGGAATGSNVGGGNITFQASNGTGAAGSGSFIFQTGAPSNSISLDATAETGGSGNITMSFTTGGGANRLLIVQAETNASRSFSAITYNGVAMTQIDTENSLTNDDGTGSHIELWYLTNPASGTYNIVATMVGSGAGSLAAASFINVDQTTPVGTSAKSNGTAAGTQLSDVSVATSAGQLVIDAIGTDVPASGVGVDSPPASGQSQLWYAANSPSLYGSGGSTAPGTGSAVNMRWNVTNADWADIAVPINPVSTNSTSDSLSNTLVIANGGNVGIDNSNPQYALDVGGNLSVTSQAATTGDIVSISNSGQPDNTGINALHTTYVGGTATGEGAGMRVDYTPGGTSGSVWDGLHIVAAAAPAAGVSSYGIKLDGNATAHSGVETAVNITSGWDVGEMIASGGIQMSGQSDPAAPSSAPTAAPNSGAVKLYAQSVDGRMFYKVLGPNDGSYALQASLFDHFVCMLSAPIGGTSSSYGGFGCNGKSINGVATVALADNQATEVAKL